MIPVQFTCGNCGHDVPFMDTGLHHYEHRNQCPDCLRSKHIVFGTPTLTPCGGLMHPAWSTIHQTFFATECEGCGFRWVTYNEDLWATLDPDTQTCWINMAWEQTEQVNGAPTIIYAAEPEYATPPPPIPPGQLTTRKRVTRRP